MSDGDKQKYRPSLHAVSSGIPVGPLSETGSAALACLPENPGKFLALLARPQSVLSSPTLLAAQVSSRYGGSPEELAVVPGGRVELPLSCENQILSLARLPVPPSGPQSRIVASRRASFLARSSPTVNVHDAPLFFRRNRVLQCSHCPKQQRDPSRQTRGYPRRRATEMAAVQCVKCGKAGEPITDPLFMGRLESELKSNVCKSCWREWEGMKVMVINEYQVNLGEESGRELVKKHMLAFLKLGEAVARCQLHDTYKHV